MRTTLPLALVALLIIALASCDTGAFNPELDCKVGTEGIVASFSDSIRNVYDMGISQPLVVDIENRGATSDRAIIQINYNKDLVEVSHPNPMNGSSNRVLIEGISGKETWNRCEGELRREVFTITPYKLPIATTSFEDDISIDVCYHYGTNFSTQVCVDPRLGGVNALEPNCRPADQHFGGGQGGPLGIVRVEAPTASQGSFGTDVRIRIFARNFGEGTIVSFAEPNQFEKSCSYGDNVHANYVFVKALLDNEIMDCTLLNPGDAAAPEGKILLRPDPQRVEVDDEVTVLKDFYFTCVAENVLLDRELEMNLDLEMYYYYRDPNMDRRTIELRKI